MTGSDPDNISHTSDGIKIDGDDREKKCDRAFSGSMSAAALGEKLSSGADVCSSDNVCRDPLASALCDLSGYYGRPIGPSAIVAGLPLSSGKLPLEHVALAAEKAGLAVEQSNVQLLKLRTSELPVLILMKDKRVLILWEITSADNVGVSEAVLSLPGEASRKYRQPALQLVQGATGEAIHVRPNSYLDSRGEDAISAPRKNWFIAAFRESRGIYAQAIAATFAINLLALAMPLFSMNVYDRVLPNAAEDTLWALGIGVMIAISFDFIIRTLRAVFVDAASRRADVRLANFIYGKLLGAKFELRPPSMGVRANTMREFETLRDFFNSATVTTFGDLPFLFLFILVIYIIAGPLSLVVFAAVPIVLAVGWLTQRALDKLIQASFRETAQKNAVVVETLVGLNDIKSAGAESWAAQKWERAVAEHVRTGLAIRKTSNLGLHFLQALQTLFQVLVVVFGFYMVSSGDITMGALIAATILTGRALAPLGQAATLLARINQARIAYRTLTEIVDAPQERPDGAAFLGNLDVKGALHFDGVSFQYDEEARPAIDAVTLRIKPGERVAMLGTIGSGKTTVLRLMQGHFAPTQGRVLLDGVSVSQVDPVLLRDKVGLLMQGAELFHGTIRENIVLGRTDATDEAVLKAAQNAQALGWINRLPLGFDTLLQERGSGLSGGQKQSLALARVLLRQPKVMLLDEPTSDMDGATEGAVIASLKTFLADRTLVLVTHRPALLSLADRLIVLDHGRIVEDGSKNEVLARLQQRSAPKQGSVGSVNDGAA